jgi:hypothetical protein
MSRFSAVGIQAGALSASLALTPELRDAVDAGVGQGVMAITQATQDPSQIEGVTARVDHGWQGVDGMFGPGTEMRTKYLVRAGAALLGLYGNDADEAYYPVGNAVDASKHSYAMRFEKNELPQVDAFWSMTMYSLPDQLMVANPINRYSIGDRSKLRYGEDGSLTIYVQQEGEQLAPRARWALLSPVPDVPAQARSVGSALPAAAGGFVKVTQVS